MATIKKTDKGYLVRWQWYENGTRRGSKKLFQRSADAKAFKAEIEDQINKGTFTHSKGMTLGEYLIEWLPTYGVDLADNTYADYKHAIERHINPNIGNIRLKDLGTLEIQKFCNKLFAAEYLPAKYEQRGALSVLIRPAKTYSAKYVCNTFGVLSAALSKAVTTRLIPQNPCAAVELPSPPEKEYVIPTAEQFPKLMEALQGSQLFPAIFTCAMLGTRRGEALGLYWNDIDFERDTITLKRAFIENKRKKKVTIGNLKTKKSERTLPMPSLVKGELLALKAKQAEKQAANPDIYIGRRLCS